MKKRFTLKAVMKDMKGKIFLSILLSLLMNVAYSQDVDLLVISNQKGAPSMMKFSELKSVFMGEKQRWPDGVKINIALIKTNNPVGKTTSDKLYDMSSDELNKFWLALVFQGKASAPNFFNSVGELETYVAQNPGAIGIIDNSESVPPDIKTVLVDGKRSF
ncbi:MAG: hypothetical protein ACTHJ5_18030 [Ilyomonas sp.]